MIIDNLNIAGVVLAELEADSPWPVDRHCLLSFAVALEFVKTDALEWTEVVQRNSDVQGQQQVERRFESNARNWFGLPPSQTLRVAVFRQDRIMAGTYYVIR